MLREIIREHGLTSDDLLHKMRLRIWDDPIAFPAFEKALRALDPTLTDAQLRAMAAEMKNGANRVPIAMLLQNLVGNEFETCDFRNRIFKRIYAEVHDHRNEAALKRAFFKQDQANDGTLGVTEMKAALGEVIQSVDDASLEKFIKFLDKDARGRVSYTDFFTRMTDLADKDHNPFQRVVRRIKYFMSQNHLSAAQLLKRLAVSEAKETAGPAASAVSVDFFGRFLKGKIDKRREAGELSRFAAMMDLDQDSFVDLNDLSACLGNLQNEAFFAQNGRALAGTALTSAAWFPKDKMSQEKAAGVVRQIRDALVLKQLSFKSFFDRLDANANGMLSFAEFARGLDDVVAFSPLVKEQLFALMDTNAIGMVDYANFTAAMAISIVNKPRVAVADSFAWEEGIVQKLRAYIESQHITPEEAFKVFDRDFDGKIGKADLKWVVASVLKEEDEVPPTKFERLFRLLDFYKSGAIQLSDIARLVSAENPYQSSAAFHATKFSAAADTF